MIKMMKTMMKTSKNISPQLGCCTGWPQFQVYNWYVDYFDHIWHDQDCDCQLFQALVENDEDDVCCTFRKWWSCQAVEDGQDRGAVKNFYCFFIA